MPKKVMKAKRVAASAQQDEVRRIRSRYYAALADGVDRETAATMANAGTETAPLPKPKPPLRKPFVDEKPVDEKPFETPFEPEEDEIVETFDRSVFGLAEDDLTKLRGVGAVMAKKLNNFGVTSYAQIAAWDEDAVNHFDSLLDLKGRISRDDWVGQAKRLL